MRKGGFTRFILQRFSSLLSGRSSLAPRRCSRITLAHTPVLPEEESTTASDRGAFTNGEVPRFEVERPVARPAPRVGNARTMTPAPRSPSPAAPAWRLRARLRDDRLAAAARCRARGRLMRRAYISRLITASAFGLVAIARSFLAR
jgi:hypothetical protein